MSLFQRPLIRRGDPVGERSGDGNILHNTERVFLASLAAEIDIGLAPLRLAEIESHGGSAAHAGELVAKAGTTYKTVLESLVSVPTEFWHEKNELRERARTFLETLHAAEGHMQQMT